MQSKRYFFDFRHSMHRRSIHTQRGKKKLIQASEKGNDVKRARTRTRKTNSIRRNLSYQFKAESLFSVGSGNAVGFVVVVVVVFIAVVTRFVFSRYPCMRQIGLFRFQFFSIFFSSI